MLNQFFLSEPILQQFVCNIKSLSMGKDVSNCQQKCDVVHSRSVIGPITEVKACKPVATYAWQRNFTSCTQMSKMAGSHSLTRATTMLIRMAN